MKRNSGWTLVEVLVSLSIIAIVVAIAAPVFHHARESARITSAVSCMHQIGKALALYRSDWDGGGYSSSSEVGLPPRDYIDRTGLGFGPAPPASPCGYRPRLEWSAADHYPYYVWQYEWDDIFPIKRKILQKYQENTLVVFDPWCNPPGTDWWNPFVEKRVIGLLLSGQVIHRKRGGIPHEQEWWAPPPD